MASPKVTLHVYRVWSMSLPLAYDAFERVWQQSPKEEIMIMCSKCARSLPKHVKRSEKCTDGREMQYIGKVVYCAGCSTPGKVT